LAGVSLHSPAHILAPPGSQTVSASRVPEETNGSDQPVPFRFQYRRRRREALSVRCPETHPRRVFVLADRTGSARHTI
jgi:hypothetical protein